MVNAAWSGNETPNMVLLDGTVNTSLEMESIIGSVCVFFFSKLTPHKEGKPTSRGKGNCRVKCLGGQFTLK